MIPTIHTAKKKKKKKAIGCLLAPTDQIVGGTYMQDELQLGSIEFFFSFVGGAKMRRRYSEFFLKKIKGKGKWLIFGNLLNFFKKKVMELGGMVSRYNTVSQSYPPFTE